MRFDCPRVAARRKRAYLGKENPFVNHKDIAGDTRQESRSAAGSDWADHKPQIRPISPVMLML
jgi:hypothetical protein